ncbi:unnamed protein product [Ceutorhynchus assimilis]|uniref:Uncharacterized protein n=1 Tax=Ceutorhynchus assimilis TaxID=467358 RepID=A0A9N9N1V9_9CUCU|nr:unnamed protein product [Ceutorhynchus assimilis]
MILDEEELPSAYITKLKEKFHQKDASKSDKISILSLLPKNWSIRKAAQIFNTSRYLVKKARNLAMEKGILAIPEMKKKPFPPEIIVLVKQFYERDDVIIMMPGQKDTKSVKINGKKCTVQKRLIFGNLRHVYEKFMDENEEIKICFAKFCSLRPEHCIFAGSGGTHNVCLCPIHENMRLMTSGSQLVKLMKDKNYSVAHYEDVLLHFMCKNPKEECFFGKCKTCPTTNQMSNKISEVLEKSGVKNITHKKWVTKPKTSLEKITVTSEEFVKSFCIAARIFLQHSFIARKQASHFKFVKNNLENHESLIICDFAENYAFVIQNAITGFHWNNDQATIFPIVFYHKINNKVEHKTLIIISDCKKHDAIAVYVFLEALNQYFSQNYPHIRKCIYFSDGAPQQFKNVKHFANIFYHESDFHRPAQWHFHATAHGKGPCDGAGGTIKRIARRTSLQMITDDQISSAIELYEWAKKASSLPNISVMYRSSEDYAKAEKFLQNRFEKCRTISGTQSFHYVEPNQDCKLKMKVFSSCDTFDILSFHKSEDKRENKRN